MKVVGKEIPLQKTTLELSNGKNIEIVHKFPKRGLDPQGAFANWVSQTETYTTTNFVEYVKSKGIECWTIEEYRDIINNAEKTQENGSKGVSTKS